MIYDTDYLSRLAFGLRSALSEWGLPADAGLSLMTISENATYGVTAPGGRRLVIRVHRPDYHTTGEILSELAWIAALRAELVVETPEPVATADGRLLVEFSDGEKTRHAVAFSHMTGAEPDAGGNLAQIYADLGGITARLHRHSREWTRPKGFTRKRWTFDTILGPAAYWGDWRAALGLDPAGRALLERAQALLARQTAAYGTGPDRFGLIHCDMRAANLLVEGDRLGVIDFDDCGFCWFAYDFAAAISFMEHLPVIPDLMAAWVEGYRRVAPLPADQEAALPMLVMLRRMQLTAWIASHAETPTAQAMGTAYTGGTVALAERYLSAHG